MQLLFPKPSVVNLNDHMGSHMMSLGDNQQLFHKYASPQQQHMQAGFNMPMYTQRMHMMFTGRTRRRRSNHSLVATMDPVAVARRNERERNRVKQVNDGFDSLRKHVPFLPDKKKLSKVEILRCAMLYIRDLKDIVEEYDHNNSNSKTRKHSEDSSS